MKLHPFALLVILSSVGDFGYCSPFFTLHSSPSFKSLSHAFAPLLPHVRKFFISPFFSWYESDYVGLFLHASPFAGFQLYNVGYNLSNPDIPIIEYSIIFRSGFKSIINRVGPANGKKLTYLKIRERELDALAFLCNRLVEELNYLQSTGRLRRLLGPPYLTKGLYRGVRWHIDFVDGNKRIGEIDVSIEGRRGKIPMEMRINMTALNKNFKIIFRSNGLPLIWDNHGDLASIYVTNLFNDVIMREISQWFAELKRYVY